MVELVEGFGRFLAATAVGLVIGGILLFIRIRLNHANIPTPDRRAKLLDELHRRQQLGQSFAARLRFLRREGVRTDVAEGLINDCERKQVANVVAYRTEYRSGFVFKYPSNWTIRSFGKSLDSNRFFTVDSLCSATVTVMLLNSDELFEVDLDRSLKRVTKTLSNVASRPISQWGAMNGEGLSFSGDLQRCSLSGVVFLSRYSSGGVHMISVCLDEDQADAGPGLELIANSLQERLAAAS